MWKAGRPLCPRVQVIGQIGPKPKGKNGLCSQAPKEQAAPKAEPPPPPPKKGGIFGKLVGLTLVGAGGTFGYAWYDPNFRKQIEDNVPYSNVALEYAFKNLPAAPSFFPKFSGGAEPGPLAVDVESVRKQSLNKRIAGQSSAAIEEKAVTTEKEEVPAAPKSEKELKAEEKRRIKREAEEKKQQDRDRAQKALEERELEEKAENLALETTLNSLIEETKMQVEAALKAQTAAAEATRTHTQKLKQAMEMSGKMADKDEQWEDVTSAFQTKTQLVGASGQPTEEARTRIEMLRAAVKDGKSNKVTKRNKALSSAEEVIKTLTFNLNTTVSQYDKAASDAKVVAEYRDLVRKGRERFKKELESVMPDVKIPKRVGGKMTEEELNSLIAHAHRRVEQLQKQLAEQQAMETQRVETALSRQKEEDEKLTQQRVSIERELMKEEFAMEKEKWEMEMRTEFERDLRHHLATQAGAHSDHLSDVLKVQDKELRNAFQVALQDHVLAERDKNDIKIASSIARLHGIEQAIKGRADLEKQGRKAQELWLACQALQNTIRTGQGEVKAKPLADDVRDIEQAGNSNIFVQAVAESIPKEAVEEGVWTQDTLFDRFTKVRRICKRVAMIDETNASLFRYFLSYIQSLFIFASAKPISESDQVDPSNLTTFVIVDNAFYSLEKGDLEQAVRYMNQLKGQARRVAADWLNEARLLLETKQAADALLAHASAAGLGSLF